MTTTLEKPSHRSLPRQPSRRNHALYRAYKIDGRSQTELAAQFGLTQGRVSQIIRRFEEWRASGAPTGTCDSFGKPQSAARSHAESLRLERWLQHERSQAIYTRSIRAFDHAPASVQTTVEFFSQDLNPKSEIKNQTSLPSRLIRTTRQLAPPAQFLRLARQASNDLGRLADKEPPPEPKLEPTDEQRLAAIREHLGHLRRKAEANNEVAKSEFPRDIINYWLAAFLGDHEIWIDPADLAQGSPLHELLNFFNPHRDDPNREGEAPAEPSTTDSDIADDTSPTFDIRPSTFDSPISPTHHSPTHPNTPENPAIPTLLPSNTSNKSNTHITPSRSSDEEPLPSQIQNPKSQIQNARARRLEHERKLEQLKEARRLGLPYHFVFDPEDGPLPPPPPQPGDYHIVMPGPY